MPNTRRLCLMNLFLHNVGELDGEPSVERSDALIAEPKVKVDYVLANPPFGKTSSMTITNEEGEEDRDALTYERQDFCARVLVVNGPLPPIVRRRREPSSSLRTRLHADRRTT